MQNYFYYNFFYPLAFTLKCLPLQTQGPPLALTVPLQWLSISRIISSWGLVISCCRPGGEGRLDCERPGCFGQCLGYKRLLFRAGRSPYPHQSLTPTSFDPHPRLVNYWLVQTHNLSNQTVIEHWPSGPLRLKISQSHSVSRTGLIGEKSHKDGNGWVTSQGCRGALTQFM